DRSVEALKVGWSAYEAVPRESRRAVLKALTLAFLADPPPDLMRATLDHWIEADPDDLDARIARINLDRRLAAQPRAADPSPAAAPAPPGAGGAGAPTLADPGPPSRGRGVLDAWPSSDPDPRYDRLRGRWALEFESQPAEAVAAFRRALAALPHDWKTRLNL